MTKRILMATGAGVPWDKVLSRVCKEQDAMPCLWLKKPTGAPTDWLPPECIQVDGMVASTDPWAAADRFITRRLPTAGEFDAFAPYEDIALFMMDRFSGTLEFPYRARRRRFLDMASFALAAIDAARPDYAFFGESPHQAFDYILYAACRIRGIPTGMFYETSITGMAGFKASPEVGLRAFEPQPYDLGDEEKPRWAEFRDWRIDREISRITGGEKPVAPYYMDQLKPKIRTGELTLGMILQKIVSPAFWKRYWAHRHDRRVQDFSTLLWPGPSGDSSRWERYGPAMAERRRRKRFKRSLRRTYRRLQANELPDEPYLLFALHFQPERTTAPDGGRNWDQVYLIEAIRSHVPAGIPIVVREHPWQASKRWANVKGRQPHEYERLARIENTILAPTEWPIQDLIDGALRVITICGTIGWEAASIGKHVWAMGPAWYLGAPGVETVWDSTDLAAATARLDASQVEPHDWRDETAAYLDRMRPSLFPGNTSKTAQPGFEGDDQILEDGFVHAITTGLKEALAGKGNGMPR